MDGGARANPASTPGSARASEPGGGGNRLHPAGDTVLAHTEERPENEVVQTGGVEAHHSASSIGGRWQRQRVPGTVDDDRHLTRSGLDRFRCTQTHPPQRFEQPPGVLLAEDDPVEGGEPQLVGGDYQGEETGSPVGGGDDTVMAVDDVERTGEEIPQTWIDGPELLACPPDLGLDQW